MRTKGETLYSIRQVINLTGASEFLLRTWELRYQAISPSRTDTGRRLYSQKDVFKIRTLIELTSDENTQKHKIGEIANLSLEDLKKLIGTRVTLNDTNEDKRITKLINLIDQFKWDDLEKEFHLQREKCEAGEFVHHYILKLIRETNNQVTLGRFTIAQEHILSALIKENLMILKVDLKKKVKDQSLKYIIASPEGDHHDIGLMIASTLISNAGKKAYYLGPNMPKQELAHTIIRLGATHVVIASTLSKAEGAVDDLLTYLHFLDHHLPKKVNFIIAGRNSAHLNATLPNRTIHLIKDFNEFESIIRKKENQK